MMRTNALLACAFTLAASAVTTGCGGSSSTSSNAATDTGGTFPITPGPPITAPDKTWTWVDFPDSKCRDGSASGIGVSLNSASDKVMIYLEGGGACYNALTCATNPTKFGAADFSPRTGGIFDRTDTSNVFADWNQVYVPFCSGDVFAGNRTDVMIDGVAGPQQFVGFANVGLFLDRLVPTFPHASQVVLTGSSAGGFGASANANRTADAFDPIPVTMLDDSGPAMSEMYVPPCLQQQWRDLWGFDDTLLKECGADCPNRDDFEMDLTRHLAHKRPNGVGGLISSLADPVITIFYGFGLDNCMPPGGFATMPADEFAAGLADFRTAINQLTPHFGTFYITDAHHTWLGDAQHYQTVVNGVKLEDWVGQLVQGQTSDVAP